MGADFVVKDKLFDLQTIKNAILWDFKILK